VRRCVIICSWLAAATALGFVLALACGQLRLMTIYGSSMHPKLHQGDLAIAWKQDSYRVGDVVSYNATWGGDGHGHGVMHRITASSPQGLTLKGDANRRADPSYVHPGQITGRLVGVIPSGGTAVHTVRDNIWTIAMIAAALLLMSPSAPRAAADEWLDDAEWESYPSEDFVEEWDTDFDDLGEDFVEEWSSDFDDPTDDFDEIEWPDIQPFSFAYDPKTAWLDSDLDECA
jgi:signal peptidase I